LVPPPWLEFTTSDPSRSATRVSPPGTMLTPLVPVRQKGRKSTWRGRQAGRDEGGDGRERQRRLGDVAVRLGDQGGAERLDLGADAVGPTSMP
jgi:hypothetical protein